MIGESFDMKDYENSQRTTTTINDFEGGSSGKKLREAIIGT
jgi:hypothetical protein